MKKKKEEPLPQIEGYEPVQRTFSMLAANIWAVVLMVAAGGVGWWLTKWIHPDAAFTVVDMLWLGVMLLVGIVVHELIHGLTWIALTKGRFSHLSFGTMQGAAYCHVDVPMTKRNYVIMALMPGLLTGMVPWLAGIAAGSLLWMLVGAMMIGGAMGDIMIVRSIRKETSDTMIYDHPNLGGCYVYEKCNQADA